jgi:hypothetical protein
MFVVNFDDFWILNAVGPRWEKSCRYFIFHIIFEAFKRFFKDKITFFTEIWYIIP